MVIHKTSKGYEVESEKGKPLSKKNLSKGQAEKRLEQVEYFKHKGHGTSGKVLKRSK